MNKGIDIDKILKNEVFLGLLNSNKIKIAELNAAIALLVKCNIGFDITFKPATTIDYGIVELNIFIRPRTALTLFFEFNNCN